MQKLLHIFYLLIVQRLIRSSLINRQVFQTPKDYTNHQGRLLTGKQNDTTKFPGNKVQEQKDNQELIDQQQQGDDEDIVNLDEYGCQTGFDFANKIQGVKIILDGKTRGEAIISYLNEPEKPSQDQEFYFVSDQYYEHDNERTKFVREVSVSKQLQNFPNINVPKFLTCYSDIQEDGEEGYAIVYEKIGDTLDIQYDNKKEEIKNMNLIQYYFNLPLQQRIQKFIELFETLAVLSNNNITLRNISPKNIKTNIDLQQLQDKDNIPENFQLLFANFQYAHSQSLQIHKMYFPDSEYIHPFTQITDSNENKSQNDVYSLCTAYFQVEMYRFVQHNTETNKWEIPNVVLSSTDLSGYDMIGNDISFDQKMQKVEDAIDGQRQRIKQYILKDERYQQEFYGAALSLIQQQNSIEDKTQQLLELCQGNCQCIIYTGIQYKIDNTPSAQLLVNALKQCEESHELII